VFSTAAVYCDFYTPPVLRKLNRTLSDCHPHGTTKITLRVTSSPRRLLLPPFAPFQPSPHLLAKEKQTPSTPTEPYHTSRASQTQRPVPVSLDSESVSLGTGVDFCYPLPPHPTPTYAAIAHFSSTLSVRLPVRLPTLSSHLSTYLFVYLRGYRLFFWGNGKWSAKGWKEGLKERGREGRSQGGSY